MYASKSTLRRSVVLFLSFAPCPVHLTSLPPQPVSVSHFARKPQLCLLSGLRSSDAYYQVRLFLPIPSFFTYLSLGADPFLPFRALLSLNCLSSH